LAIVFVAKMALQAQGSVRTLQLELLLGLPLAAVVAVLPEGRQLPLEQVGQALEAMAATY